MEDNHEKLAKEIQSICEVNETLTNALRDKKESLVNKQKEYDEQSANIERIRERNEKAQHQHSITNLYKMLEKCSVSEEEESTETDSISDFNEVGAYDYNSTLNKDININIT